MNKTIGQILFEGSHEDIVFNVEGLVYFETMIRKYRFTKIGLLFEEMYDPLLAETKDMISYHNVRYKDDIKLSQIKDLVKGLGMKKEEAMTIIKYIKESGKELRDNEIAFLDSLESSNFTRLTDKQSKWLRDIYGRLAT